MTFLAILGTILLLLCIWAIALIMKRRGNGGNDSDGGIEPWTNPPELDLPPGIVWPTDDTPAASPHSELEDELFTT